ncbi:MAG: hypothetical protein KKF48_03895 [Nanoarchaeota archaeon]|nr:hypothetical protein [Nanoarchaeota archaeon]
MKLKEVKKINPIGPNILAVLNLPTNNIPARAYIFNEKIKEIYGGLEGAVGYFTQRVSKIPKNGEMYLIGFIFGKTQNNGKKDKDIFLFPFSPSSNPNLTRAEPYITKNGAMQAWTPRFKSDFALLLADEEIHRRTSKTLKEYLNNFPKLSFHQYIPNS